MLIVAGRDEAELKTAARMLVLNAKLFPAAVRALSERSNLTQERLMTRQSGLTSPAKSVSAI